MTEIRDCDYEKCHYWDNTFTFCCSAGEDEPYIDHCDIYRYRSLVRELAGALEECRNVIGLRLSHPVSESLFASTGHLLSRIPADLKGG